MTHDETKKEAEGKFDRKKVDDLLKEGFRKLARITPMAPGAIGVILANLRLSLIHI